MTEDKRVVLLVCGNGALANAIIELDDGKSVSATKFSPNLSVMKNVETFGGTLQNTIAIHCGSGRELINLIIFCEKVDIPLIQASTGQLLPSVIKIPIIDTPNLDATTIAFLKAFPAFLHELTKDPAISLTDARIVVSHKPKKTSPPGTAIALVDMVGLPHAEIEAVSTLGIQLALGVPKEHRDQHALHRLTLEFNSGTRLDLGLFTQGIESYAKCAPILARRVLERKAKGELSPRLYKMTEFYC